MTFKSKKHFERLSKSELQALADEFANSFDIDTFPKPHTHERYLLEFALWYCQERLNGNDWLKDD